MPSKRVGLESAVILCKHTNEQGNLMTVIFFVKHLRAVHMRRASRAGSIISRLIVAQKLRGTKIKRHRRFRHRESLPSS